MNITRVVVRPVEMDKVKAMVSVTFDDSFVIHGLRVVAGEKGLFVAMPSRRLPNGEYRDVAHPINTETREIIQTAVLNEYEKTKSETGEDRAKEKVETEPVTEKPEAVTAGETITEPSLEASDEEKVEAKEETEVKEEEEAEESKSEDASGEEELKAEEEKKE